MTSSAVVTVYLGADLKARWNSYCKYKKVNASSSLRELIQFLLSKDGFIQAVVPEATQQDKTTRLEIRLKPALYAELKRRAATEGLSPNRFVTGLLGARFSKTVPIFGQYELDELTASTSQLLRLGTNLNQIARAINRNPLETDLARVELIQEIRQEINLHTQHVAALIEANLKRWSVK